MDEKLDLSWIEKGLKFHCTQCGKCCVGSSGYVYLSKQDIDRLSSHLCLPSEDFLRTYTRLIHGVVALLDKAHSEECIFLEEKKCSVYQERPMQCQTFPWWLHHLREPAAWEEAKEQCEGVDHAEAPFISKEEIEKNCVIYLDNLKRISYS